jgi:hypothetical protein
MLEKPSKYRAALFAGIVIGLVSSIPGLNLINCCCCAGIILGGVLAVYLYQKDMETGMPPLEASDGVTLGVLAGVVGAFVAVIFDLLVFAIIGPVSMEFVQRILESVIEKMEESGSISPAMADEFMEQIEQSFEESKTFAGILTNLFFTLIIYPIFALLGGLIGYAIWRQKGTMSQTPTPSQPIS